MKKILFPMAMILLVATGCLLAPAPAVLNKPPIAYIDSVSPTNSTCGDPVTFTGHGIDPDGTVVAYNWRSSPEGDLSTAPSFTTSTLSPGSHTIWFKVQDNGGAWSDEVMAIVNVVAVGTTKPVINSFEASPGSINSGEVSTLSWNVTGCTSVTIDPAIGNVALTGTRVVKPSITTTYTLKAANEIGTVTATAQVMVMSTSVNTIELFSLDAEDGYVRQDGQIGDYAMAGYTSNIIGIQGFLSFDISAIPNDAIIKSASIDLDPGSALVYGSPFVNMGQLFICKDRYTKLSSNNYHVGPATDVICGISNWPSSCSNSSLIVAAVQEQVDAASNRFQVRLQFEKAPFLQSYGTRWYGQASQDNYLNFANAKPKLIIQY